jgi:Right handed beta helix region
MRRLIASVSATAAGLVLSAGFGGGAFAATPQIIVVPLGHSIQKAVDQAVPGTTIQLQAGVYHQAVEIRTDGITLRGAGDTAAGTILKPPAHIPDNGCGEFGGVGICVLAKSLGGGPGGQIILVAEVTVAGLSVVGFPGEGVFGYGTTGLTVRNVTARDDGDYGISRFVSTKTVLVNDNATGNNEAGYYVGDSPDADTLLHNDRAWNNEFGILIRHAHGAVVTDSVLRGNCQGIAVLDDGQAGGVGNVVIEHNSVSVDNKLCPVPEDLPHEIAGGGVLLLGATHTTVEHNSVYGNTGTRFNSGGIVVFSAVTVTGVKAPEFDKIVGNSAHNNSPADLIWDQTGTGNVLTGNHCTQSAPAGLC